MVEPAKALELPALVSPQVAYCEARDVVVFTRNESTAAAYQGATGQLLWARDLPCKEPPQAYTALRRQLCCPTS